MAKSNCKCGIGGIVLLWKDAQVVHPDDYYKWVRKFNYCPICGKKIKKGK